MNTAPLKRLLAAALIAAGVAGCSTLSGTALGPDAQLAADVRARISSDGRADRANIGVGVTDGVVTLSGVAPDEATRLRIKDIVRGTEGVKGVVDNIVAR